MRELPPTVVSAERRRFGLKGNSMKKKTKKKQPHAGNTQTHTKENRGEPKFTQYIRSLANIIITG